MHVVKKRAQTPKNNIENGWIGSKSSQLAAKHLRYTYYMCIMYSEPELYYEHIGLICLFDSSMVWPDHIDDSGRIVGAIASYGVVTPMNEPVAFQLFIIASNGFSPF